MGSLMQLFQVRYKLFGQFEMTKLGSFAWGFGISIIGYWNLVVIWNFGYCTNNIFRI